MTDASDAGRHAEPFIKWAGGKRLVARQLRDFVPTLSERSTYFEPFLGGGALFFRIQPPRAILGDAIDDLVEAFTCVRDEVDRVIEHLRAMPHEANSYYRIRATKPRSAAKRAARFIYLNKTCFNGLYRVNLRGQFNVPFGQHPPALVVCDEVQLRAASRALSAAKIISADFETTLENVRSGDVVYCDPPYTLAHSNNGFVEYNAEVFSWSDQRRLADVADELRRIGARVLVNNADHPSITRLYPKARFRRVRLRRWSTMASKSSRRFPTSELLLIGDG